MDNALLSFFQQDKDLVTENRPLRLRLAHPTQMLEDVLLPQVVQGSESICGSVEYRIMCVSLDAFIPLKELIALPVAIDIVTDCGDMRSICGIVTEARAGDSDGGLASYQLVLRDALSVMEKRTNSRVFRNKNEVEIVTLLLDEWIQKNPIIGTCFRYEMDELFAHRTYPQREFTMQYNESDAAFIRRLLKRRGIAWYFRAEQGNSPSHTLVLFNHPDSLPPNSAGVVRYHRDAATEERDTINSWCAVRTLQPSRVTRFSWDHKNPRSSDFMLVSAQGSTDQGETGNEMAASLDDYQVLSPHAGDDYDDLCQLGELAMNRHDFDSKCFHGEGSVRDMCAGEYFTLGGHPEIDSHSGSDCDFVVTSMQMAISNNLSKGLSERVQRMFSGNRSFASELPAGLGFSQSDTRVKVAFNAVRRGISIVPAYDQRIELPNVPLQSAIVVGPGEEEVHCDELGRVKIRFRSSRPSDHEHAQGVGASDNESDSAWVRVASSWAGNGPGDKNQCGSLQLPRVGSEVLVSFVGGDPDKPVIIGQLYNQAGAPPAFGKYEGLPGSRYVSGIRSREVKGDGINQLRLDDTPGEISAQLASSHGNSQLNVGFLTHPRVGGAAGQKGDGAELRSDRATAIRGQSGVLISSEAGNDLLLDRAGLAGAAGAGLVVSNHLAEIASRISEDPTNGTDFQDVVQKVENWQLGGGAPVIAIAASDGLLVGSQRSIALAAQSEVNVAGVGDICLSAGKGLYARAAQGISFLACKVGLKMIAASGEIKVQSQDGNIEISSSKRIKLIANEGIELQSPGVRIVAKGAQGDWGDGKIIQQSSGDHTIKSSKFAHTNGGDGNPERLNLPKTDVEHDQQVVLTDQQTDLPIANQKYRISVEDGQIIEGTTNDKGLTERFRTKTAFAHYEIELLA